MEDDNDDTIDEIIPGIVHGNDKIPSYPNKGNLSDEMKNKRQHLVSAHMESFNYFLDCGIYEMIKNMEPSVLTLEDNLSIKFHYSNIEIGFPLTNNPLLGSKSNIDNRLTPREAREREISYSAPVFGTVVVSINNEDQGFEITSSLGEFPMMVKSNKCHLNGLSKDQLIKLKEEPNEYGGYFIINGKEKLLRLIQILRRHYPIAIERGSYKTRGPLYSNKGVIMRCVRSDQSSVTLTLHYLINGLSTLRFTCRRQEFFVPVFIIAKALNNITDKELYQRILQNDYDNTFLKTRIEMLLYDLKNYSISTQLQARQFLGKLFKNILYLRDSTDEEAGEYLLNQYVFVHCTNNKEKLDILIFMIRKLYLFAEDKILPENVDSLNNHELLLPGHVIGNYFKEKLIDNLNLSKVNIYKQFKANKLKFLSNYKTKGFYSKVIDRMSLSVCKRIESFISTGNLMTTSGMDIPQTSGFSIMAERLNYLRFLSHFQSVHRGQYFTTMKTTTVRKLLPESWGFMCPVHTPDGAPCGLLNHLAKEASLVCYPTTIRLPLTSNGILEIPTGSDGTKQWATGHDLIQLLTKIGVEPSGFGSTDGQMILSALYYIPVLLDGILIGSIHIDKADKFVEYLRLLKVSAFGKLSRKNRVDPTMEILHIKKDSSLGCYPGIFLYTEPGRFVRPVLQLATNLIEYIGPMEQVYLHIACLPEDIKENLTTHIELYPTAMLSHIASMTPFSDYNQSPRNMYQCQMGKQTMGTPALAIKHRVDNKLFYIINTQAPICQTITQREYGMEEYPNGCNAVVAVISYTGYDMEDAMIINKSSYERGFGHACIYKTKVFDLDEEERGDNMPNSISGKPEYILTNVKLSDDKNQIQENLLDSNGNAEKYCEDLDYDGLPYEGTYLTESKPILCLLNIITKQFKIIKHKDVEPCYVQTVRIIGPTSVSRDPSKHIRKVSITFRYRRNPIIGDKFSSRHGQKGTLSVLWPQENMPFTESGIFPDVLINPHAFPSRMTIGMLIESMAGKAGAMHGVFQDATPFQFHENNRAIDYVGEQLRSVGYHYYGSETLYNGMTGNVMQAEIFIGIVFYQRLRHMVSDKSQVRSTGTVTALTRQPVKGRKNHGGIRLGEMERDSLLSHGVSFCLHDRLMNCSDSHLAYVCNKCGGLISVYSQNVDNINDGNGLYGGRAIRPTQMCTTCKSAKHVKPINLPFVYRYLLNELAGMGIKVITKLSE